MNPWHHFTHQNCEHYISEYYIGFRMVEPREGDTYEGKKFKFHSLVFMLEGEVEFSYNEFVGLRFKQGEFFFMPQASLMYGLAIADSRMLVLTFSNKINVLCDNCTLTKYISLVKPIEYQFGSLPIHPMVQSFVSLMVEYIDHNVRCSYLHQIKQKELFVLLQYCYTKEEVINMFYPVLNKSTFYTWVLENYTPEMSMTELAMRCNMTPKSFSRKFNDKFGMTFRAWMLEQKVKQIKLRLSIPDASFKEIMRDFNFSNSSHFGRFCKENYGKTPTALASELRGKHTEK